MILGWSVLVMVFWLHADAKVQLQGELEGTWTVVLSLAIDALMLILMVFRASAHVILQSIAYKPGREPYIDANRRVGADVAGRWCDR